LIDHAEHKLAGMRETDQYAKHRHAREKRLRSIERIKHPCKLGACAHRRILLAENPVIGIASLNQFAQNAFGLFIDLGDGAPVRL
jgi:hypothetical protein